MTKTNLYEILIRPDVGKLFITDIPLTSLHGVTGVRLTKESTITFEKLENSRVLSVKTQMYTSWLLRQYFYDALRNSTDTYFDLNDWEGEFTIPQETLFKSAELSLLRRVQLKFFTLNGKHYLAVAPHIGVYNRLSLDKLISKYSFERNYFLENNVALVFVEHGEKRLWKEGFIRSIDDGVKVEVPRVFNGTINVELGRVIPRLWKRDIILNGVRGSAELNKLLVSIGRKENEGIQNTIQQLVDNYLCKTFSTTANGYKIGIDNTPVSIDVFHKVFLDNKSSPKYIIDRNDEFISNDQKLPALSAINVKTGIKEYPIVVFATPESIKSLHRQINALNSGISSGKFIFSLPSKYGIKLKVVREFVVKNYEEYLTEADKFIYSTEDQHKDALAVAYLPENSNVYYRFKAKLAAHGKVSQIRSKDELDIYSAWNLATNIFAKFGQIPWSISDVKHKSADLILGFSYSSLKHEGRLRRNIGYVNVFDKKGVWKFMRSHTTFLDFDKRKTLIPQLVKDAISSYSATGDAPKVIDIHYSKKFSSIERKLTYDAIKDLIPAIQEVNFISIDTHSSVMFFGEDRTILNNTYGLNEAEYFLPVLIKDKTARLIRLRIWREEQTITDDDIKSISDRVLAMTKLNWRTAVQETFEPVTLRYSHEIAKLTNKFSLTEWNTVNNQLSRIPWFI